ncbi:MAG: electron transfer flavoprotein subunit alpha/FixB family protein [Candidatus Methanomethylophilus sp.]|nr:electron transfer flavoprotein subunit alpha/FixB family protein [Methanomethylophilus sp.]MDD3233339.1 electron transfer flavoprotein subunit alpha/FixB family protein [Methanomethylophilus sp.]MDD4222171.1 electron transfer flavoprotein subunit alpha/FixB family protein [Methanomethylophilus sp.]MDD4668330.1 electron transfer flavoprotein subunit alpha/FixB family protein [Methanomethylophilus sp.]
MLERYKLNQSRADGTLVWLEIEHTPDGTPCLADVSKEILGRVRQLDNSRVFGVIFGHIELKPLYPEIFSYGVETLYEVHERRMVRFQPEAYAEALAQIAVRIEPAAILMGATPRGRELAPRTAALLDTGLTADCTGLQVKDRDLLMTRPAFGGNLLATIQCTTYPQMATVRPGTFPLPAPEPGREGTVIYWQYCGQAWKDIVSSESVVAAADDDICKAKVLVALGAGVKKTSLPVAESVARKLGGMVCCSRKLVEKGWFPASRQVGQSGRSVAPDLYLAFGISGSVQHLAGIASAKRIVSVNTDPEARIGEVADEIVVGDADAILKELDKIL